MPKKTRPKFEQALAELEELVALLEHGDVSLEDALKHFERGVRLTRACQEALRTAEQRVQQLVEDGDEPRLEPMSRDD